MGLGEVFFCHVVLQQQLVLSVSHLVGDAELGLARRVALVPLQRVLLGQFAVQYLSLGIGERPVELVLQVLGSRRLVVEVAVGEGDGLVLGHGCVELAQAVADHIPVVLRAVLRLLHTGNHHLVVLEGVAALRPADALLVGVECGDGEVAVAHAAPSPVDVVEAVGIDAVEHEEVACILARHAAVGHWASGQQLVDERLLIVGHGGVVALQTAHSLVVVEIADERGADDDVVGTGAYRGVVALEGCAHVEAQLGHLGLLLGRGMGVLAVGGQDEVPVVGGVEVGGDGGLGGLGLILHGAVARVGPAVIAHHLCQGRGHAARGTDTAVGLLVVAVVIRDVGAEVVVGCLLVPLGVAQQGLHGCRSLARGVHPCFGVAGHVAQLALVLAQPPAHVLRHTLGVERAAVGIAQDLGCAVVAADDDIACGLPPVEGIVETVSLPAPCGMGEGELCGRRCLAHLPPCLGLGAEVLGDGPCLLQTNGRSDGLHRQEEQCHGQREGLLFHKLRSLLKWLINEIGCKTTKKREAP